MKKGSSLRFALIWVPSLTLVVLTIFPYLWIFLTSIKPEAELWSPDFHYLPQQITLDNYRQLLKSTPVARFFLNSTIVASLSTVIALTVTVSAAYAFSRFRFRGRNFLMILFLEMSV